MAKSDPQFQVREIVWVELPQRMPPGHEQLGRRPAVILAIPETLQTVPYSMLVLAPITSRSPHFQGPLFIALPKGAGGLPLPSTLLLDQIAAIDASRVIGRIGKLRSEEHEPILEGLRILFGFTHQTLESGASE